MFRKLAGILAVCGAACFCQNRRRTRRTTEFQKSVMPVLSARCVGCHSTQLKSGNLNLEQFRNASLAPQQTEIWKKVRDRLTAGTMPPPPAAPPSKVESAAVIGWIDHLARPLRRPGPIDPGRVTARRLNRVEYDNTIRDLLGVTIRPAAEFPTDDSGLRLRQHRRRAFAIAAADGEADVRRAANLPGGGLWRIVPAAAEPAGEDQAEAQPGRQSGFGRHLSLFHARRAVRHLPFSGGWPV